MPSADGAGQRPQEHDGAPPLTPEKDTDKEGAGSPTEPSQTDDEGSVDENGVTTLMKAASRNDVDAVKHYIPYQARMVAKFVKAGRVEIREGTALMVAAVLGHAKVVKLLMKYERRMRDSENWTALMWAAGNGCTEVVRLLLEAEGGMEKSRGFTALLFAAHFGHLDCVKLLLEKERDISGRPAIRLANAQGYSEIVSFLESEGIMNPYLQMQSEKLVSEPAYLLIASGSGSESDRAAGRHPVKRWAISGAHAAACLQGARRGQAFSPRPALERRWGETVTQMAFSSPVQKPSTGTGPLRICKHKPL